MALAAGLGVPPSPPVTVSLEPDVAWVRLNRPDRANCLGSETVNVLHDSLQEAARAAPVIVIQGAGKNFCGGLDLADGSIAEAMMLRLGHILTLVRSLPALTIALVHGHAVGAGADLALACDIRLAVPDTAFRFPGFRKFGVVLGTERLVDLIGVHRALEARRP